MRSFGHFHFHPTSVLISCHKTKLHLNGVFSHDFRLNLSQDLFSVCSKYLTRDHTAQMVVMDKNLGQNYSSKSDAIEEVQIQMKETNTGERSNICNQCEYASSWAGDLKTHLKIHIGEKPNKCNQCDYASSWASALRRHLKVHNGEKPNKCNQCDYASSDAGNLRLHLKTHSGERSNKCNQCTIG